MDRIQIGGPRDGQLVLAAQPSQGATRAPDAVRLNRIKSHTALFEPASGKAASPGSGSTAFAIDDKR